jgi:hypothetical protein
MPVFSLAGGAEGAEEAGKAADRASAGALSRAGAPLLCSSIVRQFEGTPKDLQLGCQGVSRPNERWFASELCRQKGQLLLRQGNGEAAEELYCKALSVAREQEAKLWELRAAVSLARLRGDQGRRTEARDFLAQIYGWFSEGFDMPDLKEATALLEELE